MTPAAFEARIEAWSARAHDGSFDASIRKSLAFQDLTRQRDIRTAGAVAFMALFPLTASVLHTFAALPSSISHDVDPVTRALALHGECDRWSGTPAWTDSALGVGVGVDDASADASADDSVERLARRIGTTLILGTTAMAMAFVYASDAAIREARRRRARKETPIAATPNAATLHAADQKRGSAASPASFPETPDGSSEPPPAPPAPPPPLVSAPRFSPPPPPPPPIPMLGKPGSLAPLRRPHAENESTPPPPPPPPFLGSGSRANRLGAWSASSASSASSAWSASSDAPDSNQRLPPSTLRRSLAMSKLRRAVSSRANAKLREVNAAANEAPNLEIVARMKNRLDPRDVLEELAARSNFLRDARNEAETHAEEIQSLRAKLENLNGTCTSEQLLRLRDEAERVLSEVTDEPRVLRLLEFPELRLESLRVAAAHQTALEKMLAELSENTPGAKTTGRSTSTRVPSLSPPAGPAASHRSVFLDHRRAFSLLDACVALCDSVDEARAADERRFAAAGIAFDWGMTTSAREAAVRMCGRRLTAALELCRLRPREPSREGQSSVIAALFRDDPLQSGADKENADPSRVETADARNPSRGLKPKWGRDARFGRVSENAFELWVLRSACDLAYRAYARCGGVDVETDAAAAAAEIEIGTFDQEDWRGAEVLAGRAKAAGAGK